MRERASEDIHMRITSKNKALLQHAATLSGHVSLSGFISFVATQEAKKIVSREEVTLLSDEGMDYVLKLLNDPPPPNENLKDLMKNAIRNQMLRKQDIGE